MHFIISQKNKRIKKKILTTKDEDNNNDVNIEEETSKWGADVNCMLPINKEMGVPVVNAEGFVRITPSVRAILSVNDLIKLYQGETRVYAGKYASRGGSATVLLKFIF